MYLGTIRIVRAGFSCAQDLGRHGLARYGISVNGSADQYSSACANILMGNPVMTPVIEVTAQDFSFIPSTEVLFACTGAEADVCVDHHQVPQWQPQVVASGSHVSVSKIRRGLRCYVAFRGHIDEPLVLGSVAPDPSLGIGHFLAEGEELVLASDFSGYDHPYARHSLLLPHVDVPRLGSPWVIPATYGPDIEEFGATRGLIFDEAYRVSTDSNHVGLRLTGTAPSRLSTFELLSRGAVLGAVEVTPAGGVIILMRGRSATAGYPVIAVVTRVGQSLLGQVRPGDLVRFRRESVEQAIHAAIRQQALLSDLRKRVNNLLTHVLAGSLDGGRSSAESSASDVNGGDCSDSYTL